MLSSTGNQAEILLSQALAGSQDSFGKLLGVYRNYLHLLVVSQLEKKLQQRVSPSDVLQETFLEANRDFHQFRGCSIGEFCSWLRQILAHNLHRVIEQHVLTAKRSVRREISLERLSASLDHSSARIEALLPDLGTSPSLKCERHEQELELANAIADLPADYRDVLVLRHIESLPFEEVAKRMQRSEGAARMLWLRAIRCMRSKMIQTSTSGESS